MFYQENIFEMSKNVASLDIISLASKFDVKFTKTFVFFHCKC